ncbi:MULTISPECIES: 2-phosphosulfolactate phosphatase [Brevibacillus]|mgnify:CR=1 FL=1|uniref:Probable 2-phosphosulfolactate phosphatase n=1 Tax=Brevibacillus parabrevis TaxID=54914 RepID=A0A4Y3PI30_BREPA|nr:MULTISPECIES: 2-phosphosulfolactate phosphatase [Brevibacillus]NRQ52105.1 2-phosphosulfolactate phosphatase [Brevibacillus sp. HD1.4A]MBU8712008.1 2-phosphosulfolactate phosphatase [Brevibacillus parabrevis]MDH6349073.1 2-phosphosulfolactate phosphatase [Brevibacillus sp. 1238]MDR5001087.1 2-phosphosulfolactate phosphatase [Brevibacillus parabrevis]MED1724067.1 2-phosphosulfolactate phosphatase [Brevibacillus parabrevis]
MRIEVVPTVEEIRFDQISNHVVIVIDVLRASSTIVTALGNGFVCVVPVETIGQANSLRAADCILAGERHCRKIPDFDCNNSPTEISAAKNPGKRLILTTTNGTRAIQKAERASALLVGCFLNATACIRHALTYHLDVTLYCAGTRSEFALEDGLAAGLMIVQAQKALAHLQICDLGEALKASYLYYADKLGEQMLQTTTGKRLVSHHFADDLRFCAQVDRYTLVPYVKDKRILPHLVS